MQIYLRCLLVVVSLCSFELYAAPSREVPIGPAEDWVIERSDVLPGVIPEEDIDNGVHYLLSDQQVLVSAKEPSKYFQHYTEIVVNQKGLEYSSQIQVQFDPVYQSLTFHKLRIIRGDRVFDKLDSAAFKLLQRENELEELIYNGRLTASVILDDVRVGDIIDYSYTIEGSNPIYEGIFSFFVPTQWGVPLQQQYFRLLWQKQTPLYMTALNTDIIVTENGLQDAVEYAFEAHNSEPLVTNSEIPGWYSPFGVIIFSESGSWSDVVSWAVPMYQEALADREGVKSIANAIRESTQDKAEQVVEALVYVQKNIRYMGIETGVNSHRPSPAYETLQRRYGDCKDKAVLYIAILDELGIKAYPALVNTEDTKRLGQLPPSVKVFDHVIVLVEPGSKSFWFDPTRNYQYGSIDEISQADYGYALVVRPESDKLTAMDIDSSESKLVVHDVFDLTKGSGSSAKYSSKSAYYGVRAEQIRNQIATNGLTTIEVSFTDFYQAYYPGIERTGKIRIDSEPGSGKLVLFEEFDIEDFWEVDESNNKSTAEFYANLIANEIAKPEQLNRNSPYSLTFPDNVWQTIEIKFDKGDWQFDNEKFVENNEFFLFEYSAKFDKNEDTLLLKYHIKVKVDHVPVDGVQRYLDARDKLWEYTSYSIFEYIDPTLVASSDSDDGDFRSALFLYFSVGYILALIFALVSWRLDARRKDNGDSAIFYPVSLFKLWMFSVVTFGVYTSYWFYRNWAYLKAREKSSIMPIARAIFSQFWYYPLYRRLVHEHATSTHPHVLPHKALAILLAIMYFLSSFLGNVEYVGSLLTLLSPLAILPLANYINHIDQPDSAVFSQNSRWKLRHYLLAVFFIPVAALMYGGETNLVASSKVIDGNGVWKHDLKFMQRKGIVPADEKIIMFYSDADFDIRSDGNGFTQTQVFSYWLNDDDFLEIRRAALEDVEDIRTHFADELGENTTFTIVEYDGSEFVLYASTDSGRDREFDARLRVQWQLAKANRGDAVSMYETSQADWVAHSGDSKPVFANAWLLKAADAGNAAAQFKLGLSLFAGIDGESDPDRGLGLIVAAADKGDSGAEMFLGDLYSKGIRFPRDDAKAIAWYEKALAHKHGNAAPMLAWHLSTVPDSDLRDGERAIEIIQGAVSQKRSSSNLGILAAAYAETGAFDKSVEIQSEAISLDDDKDQDEREQRRVLAAYESGKPWRETWTNEQYKRIEHQPLLKFAPIYPVIAQSLGIVGWATTEYDIEVDGSVSNVRIVDADPEYFFEDVSIEAARKFQYFPRVVDGKAQRVKAVQNRFTYELE